MNANEPLLPISRHYTRLKKGRSYRADSNQVINVYQHDSQQVSDFMF